MNKNNDISKLIKKHQFNIILNNLATMLNSEINQSWDIIIVNVKFIADDVTHYVIDTSLNGKLTKGVSLSPKGNELLDSSFDKLHKFAMGSTTQKFKSAKFILKNDGQFDLQWS